MQMVPRMRHLILEIKMRDWIEIDIIFRNGAAPEFSVKAGWSSSNIGLRALCMCVRRIKKWENQEAVCSGEWIEAFIKDLEDGRTELRLREKRRALGLE